MKESKLQEAVVTYLSIKYPNVLYCSSLGGIRCSIVQARLAKRCGYVKGMPDLFIYEPKESYHGMAIELKTDKGRATKEQKEWIKRLNDRGYYAVVSKGFENIIEEINTYLT